LIRVGLIIADTGEIYGWGFNRDYQLGITVEEDMPTPTRITGFAKRIKSLRAGLDYNFAITGE
jgi:alpha-tubulin suppressor-like RCC1 family protein